MSSPRSSRSSQPRAVSSACTTGTSTPREASRSRTSRKGQRVAAAPPLSTSSALLPSGTYIPHGRCRVRGARGSSAASTRRRAWAALERGADAAGKGARPRGRRAARGRAGAGGTGEALWARDMRRARGRACPRGTTSASMAAKLMPLVERAATELGGALSPGARTGVETWLERLQEWNARIDLTAARSDEELVDLMLADALVLAARIPARRARRRRGHGGGRAGARARAVAQRPTGHARRAAGQARRFPADGPRRDRTGRRRRGARPRRSRWPARPLLGRRRVARDPRPGAVARARDQARRARGKRVGPARGRAAPGSPSRRARRRERVRVAAHGGGAPGGVSIASFSERRFLGPEPGPHASWLGR